MTITITLNGEPYALLGEQHTPNALLQALQLAPEKVAIECNRSIVPTSQFASHHFAAGDEVEIVHFIGGG